MTKPDERQILIIDPHTGLPLASFAKSRDDADWLQQFLENGGLRVLPGSRLEQGLEAARRLGEAVPGGRPPPNLAKGLGASFLARALRRAHEHPSFMDLRRLLPALTAAGGDPIQTLSAESTQPRNVVLELMIGACLLAMGVPCSSAEPDLVLEHGGRWNIAVKSVYSTSTVTLMNRVAEGVAQTLHSPCSYAMVFVSVSNLLRHDQFLPLVSVDQDAWGYFADEQAGRQAIDEARRPFERTLREESGVQLVKAQENTRFRGVLLLAQSVCGVDGNGSLLTGMTLLDRSALFGSSSIPGPEHALSKRFFETVRDLIAS